MGDSLTASSSSDEDDWSQSEEDVWSPSLREDVFAGTDVQYSGRNEPRHVHLPPLVHHRPHSSTSTHSNATRPYQPQTYHPPSALSTSSQTRLATPLHRSTTHKDPPSLPHTQSRIEASSQNNISNQRQGPQNRGIASFFPYSSTFLTTDLMSRERTSPEQRSDTPEPRQRSPSSFRDFEYSLAENLSRSDTPHRDYNYNDFVDLTAEASPPNMALASDQRKSTRSRRSSEAAAAPPNSAKRRRTAAFQSDAQTVEEVDLRDVDDDKGLSRVLEQQRMATIKAQQEQADMPVKLSTKQCIICMDQMTNITVTHCGKPPTDTG